MKRYLLLFIMLMPLFFSTVYGYSYRNKNVTLQDMRQAYRIKHIIQAYWSACKDTKHRLAEISKAEDYIKEHKKNSAMKDKVKAAMRHRNGERFYLKKFGYGIFRGSTRVLLKSIENEELHPLISARVLRIGLDYYDGELPPRKYTKKITKMMSKLEQNYPIDDEYKGYAKDLILDLGSDKLYEKSADYVF